MPSLSSLAIVFAATSSSPPPWWASGVIGLVGVAIGVLLKAMSDTFSDRRKFEREDQHRFTADRRAAYVHLLSIIETGATATQLHELYRESIDSLELKGAPEAAASARAYIDSLTVHLRAVDEALAEVELLAPSAVIAAASEFVKVGKLWSNDRRDAYNSARQEFIRLARADLDITNRE